MSHQASELFIKRAQEFNDRKAKAQAKRQQLSLKLKQVAPKLGDEGTELLRLWEDLENAS